MYTSSVAIRRNLIVVEIYHGGHPHLGLHVGKVGDKPLQILLPLLSGKVPAAVGAGRLVVLRTQSHISQFQMVSILLLL